MDEEPKQCAPAWMVSFGDMMTLILTFFILLVSMSQEQQQGLVAKGIGSFVLTLRSFGLPGMLSEEERAQVFDNVRMRFNLPPEPDPELQEEHDWAETLETLRAKDLESLRPHDELGQPMLAVFAPDSAELTEDAMRYVDLLAPTLRPGRGHVLQLEGHALDAGPRFNGDDRWLALSRALAVRDHLVEEHRFPPARVQARAWAVEIDGPGERTRSVDARLILPASIRED
jgi:chemotaxis protein MotB